MTSDFIFFNAIEQDPVKCHSLPIKSWTESSEINIFLEIFFFKNLGYNRAKAITCSG